LDRYVRCCLQQTDVWETVCLYTRTTMYVVVWLGNRFGPGLISSFKVMRGDLDSSVRHDAVLAAERPLGPDFVYHAMVLVGYRQVTVTAGGERLRGCQWKAVSPSGCERLSASVSWRATSPSHTRFLSTSQRFCHVLLHVAGAFEGLLLVQNWWDTSQFVEMTVDFLKAREANVSFIMCDRTVEWPRAYSTIDGTAIESLGGRETTGTPERSSS
jgi:hypothetical protein